MENEYSRQLAIIASEIQQMAQKDQEARKAGDPEKTAVIDQNNLQQLEGIVKRIGWPTRSKVGEEAAHAAWLIVQHADTNPAFQRHCLELISAEPKTEVALEDRAFLTDRVLVNEGRPQLYGTQWRVDQQKGFVPEEIENLDTLDARRAKAGMEPFAEYAEAMKEMYRNLPKQEEKKGKDT